MTAQARTGTDAPEAPRDLAEKSAAQAKEKLETMMPLPRRQRIF